MSVPASLSTLESFLSATALPIPSSLSALWQHFYEPSAFGVAVPIRHMDHPSTEYFVPTLSAIHLPSFQYSESVPPHDRPPLWVSLEQLGIKEKTCYDQDSWLAVLWRPISRIPAEALDGSILVYYSLDLTQASVEVIGLLGSRLDIHWTKCPTTEASERLISTYELLCRKATDIPICCGLAHHDNTYIVSRGLYSLA
jgi:hypothetical protein